MDAVAAELKARGYYVARHSYSYMVIEKGSYAASLHLYPSLGKATLRVHARGRGAEKLTADVLLAVEKYFPGVKVKVARV